jgi:hypothetical protein
MVRSDSAAEFAQKKTPQDNDLSGGVSATHDNNIVKSNVNLANRMPVFFFTQILCIYTAFS